MRSTLLIAAAPPVLAAITAFALTPLAARLARRLGAVDLPGERKVHDRPIARLGGVAVVAGALAGLGLAALLGSFGSELSHSGWSWPGLGLGLLPVLWVAIRDDVTPVRPWLKLVSQTAGASVAVCMGISLPETVHLFGMPVHLGWIAAPLSVTWIVGITNAFNLIDGLDGLCAGLSAISAAAMGLIFVITGQPALAMIAAVLAGAIAGFLPHNSHPARIFLGDSGAMTAGYLLSCLALAGGATLSSGFATLLPIIILGLPIAEIVVSFFRRLLLRAAGEQRSGVMVADRLHFHHRLLDLGFEHPRAVWVLYLVGAALATVSLVSILLTARQAGLLLFLLLLAAAVGVKRLGYGAGAKIQDDNRGMRRALFIGFADVAIALVALVLAVGLIDGWTGRGFRDDMGAEEVISYGLATLLSFWGVGLYRGTWWLKSLERLLRVVIGIAAAPLLVALLMFLLREPRLDEVLLGSWTVLHLGAVLLARSAHRVGAERMGSLWTGSGKVATSRIPAIEIDRHLPLRAQRLTESGVSAAVRALERARALDEPTEGQRKAG